MKSRRTAEDYEWADEVVRRWQRRRYKVQQRDKAIADLRTALLEVFEPVVRWMTKLG